MIILVFEIVDGGSGDDYLIGGLGRITFPLGGNDVVCT